MQKKIKARALCRDFQSGMDARALMDKYDLRQGELDNVLAKCAEKGLLDPGDLARRMGPRELSAPSGVIATDVASTAQRDSGVVRAIEQMKFLDMKDAEKPIKAPKEGITSIFLGLALAGVGVLVSVTEVPGITGAILPIVLGLFVYLRGCYFVAAKKGYTGREGVFLGFLVGVGAFVLLILPDRRTGDWGVAPAFAFGIFIAVMIVLLLWGLPSLQGHFIIRPPRSLAFL